MRTRIHVWGGLGSQLYAFAMLLTLQKLYPARKFKIVFHTGGVTERQPEIVPLIENLCTWTVQNDFQKSQSVTKNLTFKQSSKLDLNFRLYLKKSFFKLGFVKLCNESFPVLYPWTSSIRGHYRHLSISQEVLVKIVSAVNTQIQVKEVTPGCALHFRLGDLIGLKLTISPHALKKLLTELASSHGKNTKFEIYSDSPELAKRALLSGENNPNFFFPELDIWTTVINCINSTCFVGTNSKISYWVSYLRLCLDQKAITYLPSDLESDLANTLGNLSSFENLKFFPAEYQGLD